MKIKRYVDKDMRQVLRRVREDQGPDAVILSNRRVEEGIEVIAAIDYDEALVRHAIGSDAGREAKIDTDTLSRIAEDDVAPANDVEVVNANLERTDDVTAAMPDDEALDVDAAEAAAMRQLKDELTSMRGLLETQLSDLVWRDTAQRFPLRAQLLRNLARLGIAPDVAGDIVERIGNTDEIRNLWSAPLTAIAQSLPVIDDDLNLHLRLHPKILCD